MDGPFWVDLRTPHIAADVAAVTLISANVKAAVPIANLPVLGANYFGFVGKACRIRMWGRMSPVATPGNLGFSLLWGTGADNNGTAVLSYTAGAGSALTAGSNLTWELDAIVRCRVLGVSGALIGHGMLNANPSLIAASLQPVMIPPSAPAQVTVDLTQNFVLSPQFLASGSAGTTLQVHEFTFEALN